MEEYKHKEKIEIALKPIGFNGYSSSSENSHFTKTPHSPVIPMFIADISTSVW